MPLHAAFHLCFYRSYYIIFWRLLGSLFFTCCLLSSLISIDLSLLPVSLLFFSSALTSPPFTAACMSKAPMTWSGWNSGASTSMRAHVRWSSKSQTWALSTKRPGLHWKACCCTFDWCHLRGQMDRNTFLFMFFIRHVKNVRKIRFYLQQ